MKVFGGQFDNVCQILKWVHSPDSIILLVIIIIKDVLGSVHCVLTHLMFTSTI